MENITRVFNPPPCPQIVATNFTRARNFSDIISQSKSQLCKLYWGHLGGEVRGVLCPSVTPRHQGLERWNIQRPTFLLSNSLIWSGVDTGISHDLVSWNLQKSPCLKHSQLDEQVEWTLNWTSAGDAQEMSWSFTRCCPNYTCCFLLCISLHPSRNCQLFQLQIAVVAKLVWVSDVPHNLKWRHRLYIVISTPNLQIRHFSLLQVCIVVLF